MIRCQDCKFFHEFNVWRDGTGACAINLPPWIAAHVRDEEGYSPSTYVHGVTDGCDLGQPITAP